MSKSNYELTAAIVELTDHIRVLREAIDELRESHEHTMRLLADVIGDGAPLEK